MLSLKRALIAVFALLASTEVQATRINKFYGRSGVFNAFAVGYGYNSVNYENMGPGVIDIDFKDESVGSFYVYYEHRFENDWGFDLSYAAGKGSVEIEGATIAEPDYKFSNADLEFYSYSFSRDRYWAYGPIAGVEHATRPFAEVSGASVVEIFDVSYIKPYVGFFVDYQAHHWLTSFKAVYLYPLSIDSERGDYEISSPLMVRVNVEATYRLNHTIGIGIGWQGGFFQNEYEFNNAGTVTSGEESTTISTVLLTVNFTF